MPTVFYPIFLSLPESAPERDITQFCRSLFRYTRRDTTFGAKQFHWENYKRAVERHALPDVRFTSSATVHTDRPSDSVQGLAEYVADVLAGQVKQEVDVEGLADILKQTVFDFASARNSRWASFLRPTAAGSLRSGWEVRMVVILASQTEEDPMEFPCIVVTVRLEGAVGCDQAAWASLGASVFSNPTITVDVMHCRVSKAFERLESGMYYSRHQGKVCTHGLYSIIFHEQRWACHVPSYYGVTRFSASYVGAIA